MLQPEEDLVLDRLIHEPGRLAILTVLSTVRDADFVFLQRATGLTKGNLSSHLTKLEDAGLVAIEKRFVRKKPNTNVALTALGKQRIAHHWDQLERLKTLSIDGRPAGQGSAARRPVRQQPVVKRVAHQLGARETVELLLDARAMGLDGAHREEHLLADLAVGVAEGEQAQHLHLTIAEVVGTAERRRRRGGERGAEVDEVPPEATCLIAATSSASPASFRT